jgi:hypothetical protein
MLNRYLTDANQAQSGFLSTDCTFMKIYLTNQEIQFSKHLADLKSKAVMKFDKNLLPEKTSTIELNTSGQLHDINLDFFFNYNIFPSRILNFKTQWEAEKRSISVDDTIVQQVFIPPFRSLSQKLIFGVRINTIINESHRRGFSYETIEGHVERGESTFVIEQHGNDLIFRIQTYSEPSNLFVKIFGSWAAVPYQRYCTERALKHVKQQIEG